MLLWLALLAAGPAAAAAGAEPPCAQERLLYVPVEAVAEPLGLRGETRAQHLDRRFGAGKWKRDEAGAVVRIAPPSAAPAAPFEVQISEPPGMTLVRAQVIAEARLSYRDGSGTLSEIYGYREVGDLLLTPGANTVIRVPRTVFREQGALLVAVTLAGGGGEDGGAPPPPPVHVAAAPVREAASSCVCCVYVPDRFTAIRLNRPRQRTVESP